MSVTFQRTYRSLVSRGWVTNQHGAWAMMLLPITVGSIRSGLSGMQLLLLLAWLSAFFFYGALTLWMKVYASNRKRGRARTKRSNHRSRLVRYRPALLTFGTFAGVGAIALVLLRPELLWWAIPFAALFAVAAWEGIRGREKSIGSRTAAILAANLLTPIAYSLGTHPNSWPDAWIATATLTVYFLGTVPYVKTLLRERGKREWLGASLGYHGAIFVAATVLAGFRYVTWWIPGLAAVWLARAAVLPLISLHGNRPLRPAVVGVTEVGVSVLVALTLILPSTLT